jgi:hypothetical protein
MTWDEYYCRWSEVRRKSGQDVHLRMQEARKRVAENTPDDWCWLEAALTDANRKWFVALLFKFQPVPRRFVVPLLRAAVLERNPSLNRAFIEPCVRSFGGGRVLSELLGYLESGTDEEKAGAASALYWAGGNPRNEDLAELRQRLRCRVLREFVDNPDLGVRRRIIPLLQLVPEAYPENVRTLIPIAVDIARSHPDEYIRNRVEVQLGSAGPFMAIPDMDAKHAEPSAAPDRDGE